LDEVKKKPEGGADPPVEMKGDGKAPPGAPRLWRRRAQRPPQASVWYERLEARLHALEPAWYMLRPWMDTFASSKAWQASFQALYASSKAFFIAGKRAGKAFKALDPMTRSPHLLGNVQNLVVQAEAAIRRIPAKDLADFKLIVAEQKSDEKSSLGDETSSPAAPPPVTFWVPNDSVKHGGRFFEQDLRSKEARLQMDEVQELLDLLRADPEKNLYAARTETARLRHDLQNHAAYKGQGYLNFQIQVGGKALNFRGKHDTSISMVILDPRVLARHPPAKVMELVVQGHIQSIKQGASVIITFGDAEGKALAQARTRVGKQVQSSEGDEPDSA
jgi:hypothetical protein